MICAIAAPTALAQSPCGTRITCEVPATQSGTRKAAAADRYQRQIAGFGLHSVDRIFDLSPRLFENLAGEIARQRGDDGAAFELHR